MLVDHKVAQLLCSRLCHDLAGPAGAVTAGLELIEENGGDGAEAMDLVVRSARQVVSRLNFYRLAFGSSGIASAASLAEVRAAALSHFTGGLVGLDWPDSDGVRPSTAIAPPGPMLILNMILLGAEALPRGGRLHMRISALGNDLGLGMTASGRGAGLRPEQRDAMRPEAAVESLSARTVPGYCVARIAGEHGIAVEVSDGAEDEMRIAAILPGA